MAIYLWFTEQLGDRIGRITVAGVVTELSVGSGARLLSPYRPWKGGSSSR
jgi:hypothetical protein